MAAKPRPPQTPNYSPPVFVPPPLDYLPPGVVAREPGVGEMPPPPVQKARRLTVVDGDGAAEFVFDGQLGGSLAIYGGGRMPAAPWSNEGCLGVFSPFSTLELRIEGERPARRLVVVEQLAGEAVERVVELPEQDAPALLVEVRVPSPAEPWIETSEATRFELGQVSSLSLEDVELPGNDRPSKGQGDRPSEGQGP